MSLSIFGGGGFVLGRFCEIQPDVVIEPRVAVRPSCADVLYGISTTSNYLAKEGNLDIDIDTNLKHLVTVLPHVRGSFTYLSSWFVYCGGRTYSAADPARETDNGHPLGFYAGTKLAAELLVETYCRTNDISFRILRLCNVIGNDPRAGRQKNALEHLLGQVKRNEPVSIYTGEGYRSYLHVDDVARAIRLILDKGNLNEIYNVGTRSERVYDLIQHAMYVTKSTSRIGFVAPPLFHRTIQMDSFFMDTAKLRGLGFVPSMDAYQAVERVLANMK